MEPKKRAQLRKDFKTKQDELYKNISKRFPPSRGMTDIKSVLGLIRGLETAKI